MVARSYARLGTFLPQTRGMNRRILASLRAATLATLLCGTTHAVAGDSVASAESGDAGRWHVIASPYVWAASLNGHATLGGRRANFDMPFADIVRDLDFTIMGNIEATNERYGFYFDGVYNSVGQRQHVDGVPVHTKLRANWVSAGAFFRAYEQPLGGQTFHGRPRLFALEPTVGLRWTSLHGIVDSKIGDVSGRAVWTDPTLGLRVIADLDERWNLAAEADIGGFGLDSQFSANGQVYLGYRTTLFGYETLLRLGYRALYQDHRESTEFGRSRWVNTLQGPVAGLSVRF